MKPVTKLWLRKKALMALRSLIWHADEWLHRQEIALREEQRSSLTSGGEEVERGRREKERAEALKPAALQLAGRTTKTENFLQWEARRSGIAVISKNQAREGRRRRASARDFDLRFAAR